MAEKQVYLAEQPAIIHPQNQTTTVVVGSGSGIQANPPLRTGVWTDTLCNWSSDWVLCCIASNFPCATFGENAQLLGKDCCTQGCINSIPFVNVWFEAKQREEIRDLRGIPGTLGNDCCLACWCMCCTLIQENKELKAMEQEANPTVAVVFQPTVQYVYGPPPVASPQPPQYEAVERE